MPASIAELASTLLVEAAARFILDVMFVLRAHSGTRAVLMICSIPAALFAVPVIFLMFGSLHHARPSRLVCCNCPCALRDGSLDSQAAYLCTHSRVLPEMSFTQ